MNNTPAPKRAAPKTEEKLKPMNISRRPTMYPSNTACGKNQVGKEGR